LCTWIVFFCLQRPAPMPALFPYTTLFRSLVGGVLAGLLGFIDFMAMPRRTRAFSIAVRHLVLNLAMLTLFLVAYAWRATDHLEHDKTPWSQLALSAVAVAVLLLSVWLGNTLVYRFGRRVADGPQELDSSSRA